jgi:ATP-dependent Clp protease protease subunit
MVNKKKATTAYLDIAIPENVENMQLPSPELLTFYKNFEDRILWIDNEINDYSIEYAKYIMQWNRDDKLAGIKKEDRKPIKLLFFSPGGDLNINNMLVDTIALSETKVIGINCGMAASAACFIYLSCHERLTLPNAQFLIHQGAGSFEGTYDIVVSAITNYQKEIENLGKFVLSRTNIPENVFYENFITDWYIDANEAIKYGLCSKIITSLDEII